MMRTRILLHSLAFIGMASTATAQIPNGGFENWTTVPGTTYQDPDGWMTFNALTAMIPGNALSCEQGSPGAVGAHYATVTTRNIAGLGIVPGVLTTGDGATGVTGFPSTARPAALTGQWQYGIQANDTALVMAYFTKWNAATMESDSVGAGIAILTGTLNSWTTFNIPITYFNGNTPDTAMVGIISTITAGGVGSFVKVDNLGFNGASAVAEVAAAAVTMYPSPTTGLLHITADRNIREVRVLDLTGRVVMEQGANAELLNLDLAALRTGRYLVQLHFADGSRQVRTVVKQ